MIKYEVTNTFVTGVFPDTVADNSSGAATPDGFEFIKAYLDNANLGPLQAIMDYSAGSSNIPTGSVGVPNGVTESAGASQIVEALHKMTGSGPGTLKPWMKEDTPAVTGDRVLLLSEQGVLIASYPDLDSATWITGNTAAQVAAAAAGEKFYRSSDAGGAVGDAAGPYLQLPANMLPTFMKQYSEAGGYFAVTGTNWTTTRAVIIPYQTSDGAWRLRLNIRGTLSAGTSNLIITIAGVTFKTGADQVATCGTGFTAFADGRVDNGASTMTLVSGTSRSTYIVSADVELDSKPTWADDFDTQWGITY